MIWEGTSCICIHQGKLLMVLQGTPEEEKKWSAPSGGREGEESLEACCIREVWEETGYVVRVLKKLHIKEGHSLGIDFKVHYFTAELIGGSPVIQDPDGLIYDIRWVSLVELDTFALSFPEDRELFVSCLSQSRKIT
jgi:8-oxo-dGTP diphosphatase